MIVKRWGKYRALADFANVLLGEVIDVTGVICDKQEIMWLCRGRVSDWTHWDLPVEPVENQPHFDVRATRPRLTSIKQCDKKERTSELVEVIRLLQVHALAGEQGAIEALAELQGSSPLTENRLPITDHPKCLTCPYATGWDSVGTAYCSQPLGIATLFDEATRFPVTDEQYCSHHPQVKKYGQ